MADKLLALVLRGDPRAMARAITRIENGQAAALLEELGGHLGRALRLGVTGPPGAGKSTLVAGLVRAFRGQGRTVGVVAVDPTSPYSGGALLGDRVRMGDVSGDAGVFIRSMASRGSLGGLSRATLAVVDLLDAAGKDVVLVETVGVGQSEVAIAAVADVCLVVLSPEAGDAVQTMKAGLMEIADIFVVNKADREGAERLMQELYTMLDIAAGLRPSAEGARSAPIGAAAGSPDRGIAAEAHLRPSAFDARSAPIEAAAGSPSRGIAAEAHLHPGQAEPAPRPPVLRTVASKGEGLAELMTAIEERALRSRARADGDARGPTARAAARLTGMVEGRLLEIVQRDPELRALCEREARDLPRTGANPYQAAGRIFRAAVARLAEAHHPPIG